MSMIIAARPEIQPYSQTNKKNSADKAGTEFSGRVMKCVQAGGQKVMLNQDALMSYASQQTGESVNIYRAGNYTKEHPVYMIKGLDKDGKEFSQEVDARNIDPEYCSYNELMVLNLETGRTSPADNLHAAVVRDQAGIDSYFEQRDFMSVIEAVMQDHKKMGSWDSYLAYDQWMQSLLKITANR